MRARRPNSARLATAAILVLAAGLGLWGIGHGLPHSYYPDEAHLVKRALSFGSGDLNPHWFHKPAFYMYFIFGEYGILFFVGKLLGAWAGVKEFGVRFVRDPGVFYLIGRLSTLLFALLTVAVVIRLGERHLRPGAGLLGGLLLSLTAGLIASSQYVKEDVPSMFFAVLSLYWILNYTATGRMAHLVGAAMAGGASAATKAYGMALLPPLLAAVVWRAAQPVAEARGIRGALLRSAAALGCFGLAQFALAPFSFLDPLGREGTFGRIASLFTAVARITGLARVAPSPHETLTQSGGILDGFSDYTRVLTSDVGMGWVITVYAALGVVALAIRRRIADLILAGYLILFILVSVVVYPGYAEPRHQTPVYPVLAAAGGFALAGIGARLGSRRAWAVAALLGTLLWPLSVVASRARAISREDTRNAAKHWIERNVPGGTRLLLDENGPPLLASESAIRRSAAPAEEAAGGGQFTMHYDTYLELQRSAARGAVTYDLTEIRRPWWREAESSSGVEYLTSEYDRDMGNPLRPVGVMTYDAYRRRGIAYAVVQSECYHSVLSNPKVAAQWPSFAAFYRELFRRGRLVREFPDGIGAYTGPEVRIYRLVP